MKNDAGLTVNAGLTVIEVLNLDVDENGEQIGFYAEFYDYYTAEYIGAPNVYREFGVPGNADGYNTAVERFLKDEQLTVVKTVVREYKIRRIR